MPDLLLPEHTTPAELAEHLGVSERHIRALARSLGACSIIGNKMIITKADVQLIMESGRPTPLPPIHISPVTGRPVIGDGYEEVLELRKKEQKKKEERKKLREKSKRKRGSTAPANRGRT